MVRACERGDDVDSDADGVADNRGLAPKDAVAFNNRGLA
jgi:hypothetical protein